jgi:F0F1-type ATP synthase assembly protein I
MTPKNNPKKPYHSYVVFSGIAIQMGVVIAIFSYFGIWLDRKYTHENRIFTIVFSLLGVFVALYSTIKQVINYTKRINDE